MSECVRNWITWPLNLVLALCLIAGCSGTSNKAEKQGENAPRDVTEELERLAELRERGALTEDEFSARKRQLLGLDPQPVQPREKPAVKPNPTDNRLSIEELDVQLRRVNKLWNQSSINSAEYTEQKGRYLQQALKVGDLREDMLKIYQLWNQSILNSTEFATAKQQALAAALPPPTHRYTVVAMERIMRQLHDLYNVNAINSTEYTSQKQAFLNCALIGENVEKDMKLVQDLWNQSILNSPEYEQFKKKVLQADPTIKSNKP